MIVDKEGDQLSPVLAIGLEITIKIRGDDYTTYVRGWKPGVFILVDSPMVAGDYLKVVPETSISCRFLTSGTLVSCSSMIIFVLRQPLNIIVLEFPARYEKIKLRKSLRMTSSLPAVYYKLGSAKPEEKNVKYKATVRDLSLNGVLLSGNFKLEVLSRIALSIKLSSNDKITNILCTVKNVIREKKVHNDNYYLIGVEFKNLPADDKRKLVHYLDAQKAAQQ